MPNETQDAVNWALQQTWTGPFGNVYPVTTDTHMQLVIHVRQYFNKHDVVYHTFAYPDLVPYFPENR
jgi:3-polyprenyl-4-hydroxybenzoate decarboxylase